jgi:hypothetical protein
VKSWWPLLFLGTRIVADETAVLHQILGQNRSQAKFEEKNRFTASSEYDVKGEATVKFNVGSSDISTKDQEALTQLAQTATGLTGYIIEVKVLVNKGIAGS